MDGIRCIPKWGIAGVFLFVLNLSVEGQPTCRIQGTIADSLGDRLQGVVIVLFQNSDRKTIAFSVSDDKGYFNLRFDSVSAALTLRIEHFGYKPDSVSLPEKAGCKQANLSLVLFPRVDQLTEVMVKAKALPFSIRGDTIEFNARSYISAETKKVGDLLANIQGFQVTPDGKISFSGKEVEKILIEGEDLSDKNYQLISRNLNATYVNKIQVLKNFNDDRLMKDVNSSDKIGINLTLDEKIKNRLSGTVDGGIGTNARVTVDNNNILIGRAVKILSFLNYNNTGDLPNANLEYYYNKDLDGNESGLQRFDGSAVVSPGIIYPPDLPARYTRNNNDLSGAVIFSTKAGKNTSLRVMAGYENTALSMESRSLQQFDLPDGERWRIGERLTYSNNQKNLLTGLTLTHDRKRNNTGSFTMEWTGQKSNALFENNSSGAFSDSLREKVFSDAKFFRVHGFESFKLSSHKIFNLRYVLNQAKAIQNFDDYTTRFLKYFSLDSSFRYYSQSLDENKVHADLTAGVYGSNQKAEYAVTARSVLQQRKFEGQNGAADTGKVNMVWLNFLSAQYASLEQTFSGSLLVHLSKKLSYAGSIRGGVLWMEFKPDHFGKTFTPLVKHFSRLLITLKPYSTFNADYEFRYGQSPYAFIYPSSLISGNATILNPASEIRNPTNHQLSFHFVSNNLRRSEHVLIQASASFTDHEYRYGSDLQQEYSSLFYRTFNTNRFLNFSANFEKFVLAVRSKFGIQLSAFQMRSALFINDQDGTSALNNIRIEGKLNTGFKKAFNVELSPSISRIRNMTRQEGGEWSGQSFWQFQGSGKLKITPGKKWYCAFVYLANQLSAFSFFQSMDFYGQYKASNSFLIMINLHNLFNAGSQIQRQYAPTFYGEQRFGLVGRYLLVKFSWGF